ncbi:LptF/LptG family permease [Mesonia sp. K7]|uniref:LptF/LptG family permease n=1 Tax=Mesonia sp. K7 TaxID=2218606 RepID=UPI000DA7C46D|nr:LptF/LptG family permease [Mesonia sp. K7]PZD79366.1 permease [Mesonia sp. K7]
MKILDRYIFVSFIKTFLAVFVVLMMIFLLQGIWLYISELAGKDLDIFIISKFLFYLMPSMMAMVLPLTILVASIMTFGSFAEKYEFAAMKSSGISLQRAMRSLIFFITFLSLVTYIFGNSVIPWSQYKIINLRKNISQMQPAMAIVEGAFNTLGDINIKVAEKTGENDEILKEVIIHKKGANSNSNNVVLKAESGKIFGEEDSDILTLMLEDGNYYEELQPKKYSERKKKPFVKSYFKEYQINYDMSDFNNVDLDQELYSNSSKMLDRGELVIAIDSMSRDFNQDRESYLHNIKDRSGFDRLSPNTKEETTSAKPLRVVNNSNFNEKTKEAYHIKTLEELYQSYDLIQKQKYLGVAQGSVNGTLLNIKGKKEVFKKKTESLNKAEIQLHEKFSLPVACFILFFVGAPLGAIIRKGGLGLPMVIAVLLFLTYHFIGIFAKNGAEDGTISPFVATWVSTFIMFPLSIYLTYRATTDQGFVNTDVITIPVKNFFKKIGLSKKDS